MYFAEDSIFFFSVTKGVCGVVQYFFLSVPLCICHIFCAVQDMYRTKDRILLIAD